MNIVMLLEMAADGHPDRVAVTCEGDALTFGQLLAAAKSAAGRIHAGGYRAVGLLDVNSPAAPIAVFAAAFAGLPYVPLNYRLTKPELAALMARITPAVLITDTPHLEGLDIPEGVEVVLRAEFLRSARCGETPPVDAQGEPDSVAVQLFTSGTTGAPKAAVLRHENLLSYILETVEFGSAAATDATLVAVPPYHIAGISAVLSSTYAGRRMVQLPNFDARTWFELCRDEKITNAFVVPTMLSKVMDYLDGAGIDGDLPALKALAYGGGKMPAQVIERAMRRWPKVDFTNAYGLTETSSTICLLAPDDHRMAFHSKDPAVRRRLGSVGRPIGSVEIQVRGDDGQVLAPGQTGDIHARGGQVAGEYVGIGSLLDDGGWFATRDRGHVDEYGYLYLEGRADDVIVRGGENISPGEIEDVLREHPAVTDVAVLAIPDTQWGEAVGAAVVLAEQGSASVGELQDWVRQRLRSSRVPAAIRFYDELPYNEMGKVLRRVLKDDFSDMV